jgi:hypothetical protein
LKNVAKDLAGERGPGSKKFTHSKCGLGGWPGPHFFFQASGFSTQLSDDLASLIAYPIPY